MAREPITKHGDDHRPPGTYSAGDPGGHDPLNWLASLIPSQVVPTICVSQNFTASNIPVNTDTDVEFDSDVVLITNDGGFTLNGTPPTLPFAGDFYSFSLGGDPKKVFIDAAGIYLVSLVWQINAMDDGTLISPGQNFIQMEISTTFAGTVILPLQSANTTSLGASMIHGVTLAGTGFNSFKQCSQLGLVMSNGVLSYGQNMSVAHHGLQGDATDWDATITIARLGDNV